MRHWSQIGTRNWLAKPGRTAGAVAAIALGVGVVVWVNCAYESVRIALKDQVWFWIGGYHLAIESHYGPEGTVLQSIAEELTRNDPNIVATTCRISQRLVFQPRVQIPAGAQHVTEPGILASTDVEAVGIDPLTEPRFRDHTRNLLEGRLLTPDDVDGALVESQFADRFNLRLGDQFSLRRRWDPNDPNAPPNKLTFKLVGLIRHQRVAKQQLPMVIVRLDRVQKIAGLDADPPRVTKIDVLLRDDSSLGLYNSEQAAMNVARRQSQWFLVTSADLKLRQVRHAEQQSGFVLLLISTVALFTAFFVILSTLSMGVVERIGQLGTLRCLGVTRIQLAFIVLAEAVPISLLGMLLGVPVGLGLTRLTVWLVPQYIGELHVSRDGIVLAFAGGAITALAGSLVPMVHAMLVSPLAASRPESRPPSAIYTWIAGILGAGMIAEHAYLVKTLPVEKWFLQPSFAILSVVLLYCGYALITPVVVRLISRIAVRCVAGIVGIRHRLLADQIGRATWRSSAITCGLMVGLSLIVSIVVHSKSIAGGWDFPKHFCEAFVYISPPVPIAKANEARSIPGVAASCVVNASTQCTVIGRGRLNLPFSRFLACDLKEFFKIGRLQFVEGTQEEAVDRLRKGGHILVTPEFCRFHKVTLGDVVSIKVGLFAHPVQFKIAAVVTSPALDIAANYFNAGGRLVAQSIHMVIGTPADLQRFFRIPNEVSMFLLNFDLPRTDPPEDFQADQPAFETGNLRALAHRITTWRAQLPERAEEIDEIARALAGSQPAPAIQWANHGTLRLFHEAIVEQLLPEWRTRSPEQRWQTLREELVLQLLARRTGASFAPHASVRALKDQIDHDLQQATLVVTAIPTVALIVAALGVGNLMMANVASRSRQLAILRALGATKWQIVRLIMGEALVLGALGSAIGVALGLHAAAGMHLLTKSIWGFVPAWTIPWNWVGLGIGFTMAICLVAGAIPARHAARTNIIASLQTT